MERRNKMDVKVIELYCKYIINPLEEQKNQLERELVNSSFFNRKRIQEKLTIVQKLLEEKLRRLSEMIYEEK